MTQGPPSSAAGPSRPPPHQTQAAQARHGSVSGPGIVPQHSSNNQPYYPRPLTVDPRNQQYPAQPQYGWSAGYSSASQPAQSAYRNSTAPSYTPPPVQQPSYVAQSFPQPQRTRFTEPYPHSRPAQKLQTSPVVPSQAPVPAPLPPPPPPPPSPPPLKYRHWDRVIKDFLAKLSMKQALAGFESDMLVMNTEFEHSSVPNALIELLQGIILIQQGLMTDNPPPEQNRPLDERKLEYVHAPNPSSHTSITKSISAFLAQNRAKNDASNRAEFLHSLGEKRKRIDDDASRANPDGVATSEDHDDIKDVSSCARTDAKPIDRDVQMKYDIAKNNDGPLRRTTRQKAKAPEPAEPASATTTTSTRTKTKSAARDKKAASPVVVKSEPDVKPNVLHLGLDQRLGNIETHFSVQYVPAQPDNFLARLQFLEEHIIRLEKDFPPWAALHFNQPNRGWPPPPRATPIIVPPHLRSSVSSTAAAPPPRVGGMKTKNTGSSLQRAVMDQVAIKEARSDLAGHRQ
ncbi:hypothetical protein B0H19DRAFT_1094418 [Mycena capillaripes]|nr:hypothetical protein B0H19DRAFT_1094418 [Mycena capillaripes]